MVVGVGEGEGCKDAKGDQTAGRWGGEAVWGWWLGYSSGGIGTTEA